MKKSTFSRAQHGELKYRAKMKKVKTKWVVVGATFLGALAIGSGSLNVSAAEWVANSPEQIAQRLTAESKSITMIEGDTVWNIGLAINIKDPMSLLFDNGFKDGDQYTLEVGTIISFDGNRVTVTDPQGNVIGDKVVSDTDKVNPNETVAGQQTDTPSKPVDTDNKGYVNGPNNPSKPVDKPSAPGTSTDKPTDKPADKPETPEKPIEKPSTPSTPEPEVPTTPEVPEKPKPEEPNKPVEPETPTEKPELPTDLTSLEKQLADAKAELDRLQADLVAKEQALAEGKEAQAKLAEIEAAIADLEARINALVADIAQQEEYVFVATEAFAQQSADLQEVTTALENLLANPTEEEDYATQVEALTAQKEAITQEVTALQEDLSNYTANLEGYKAELADLQAQLEAKQAELAGVQAIDLEALQAAVDTARQAVEAQEALIAELEVKIASIKLENAKVESRNVIRALTYLTKADKDSLLAEVNAQTSIEAIAPITQKAKDLNAQRKFEAELKAAKATATNTINGLKDLTSAQRDDFLSQVNNAQAIADVNTIAENAKVQAATNVLNKVKADAHKQIDGFTYLSTGVRATYKDRVTSATTSKDVSSILAEAKAENAKQEQAQAFKIYQDAVIQDIKMLVDLTPDQQTSAVTKAQAATTKAQLDTILKDAKALASTNKLNAKKYLAKTTINNLKNITQAEKNSYNAQIDKATTEKAINDIVEAAKTYDASSQEVRTARVNAKVKLDEYGFLTQGELDGYKGRVDKATTVKAINAIVAEAEKANEAARYREPEAARKAALASMAANKHLYNKLNNVDKLTWDWTVNDLENLKPGDKYYNPHSIKYSVLVMYYQAGAIKTDPDNWTYEEIEAWNFQINI